MKHSRNGNKSTEQLKKLFNYQIDQNGEIPLDG